MKEKKNEIQNKNHQSILKKKKNRKKILSQPVIFSDL